MKLFINTCLSEVMIGLIDDEKLVNLKSWEADRQESRKLTPRIAEMIEDSGYSKADIDEVYVVTGPGSFTAVRIGFIVARAFALGLEADMYVCNTFEFLSALLEDKFENVELKAGGGKVYKIDTSDSSFEIIKSEGGANISEIDTVELFKDKYLEVLEKMVLVKDVMGLEPNYVKEPNITIAKG